MPKLNTCGTDNVVQIRQTVGLIQAMLTFFVLKGFGLLKVPFRQAFSLLRVQGRFRQVF